jgi:hypothetical protein
MKINVKASMQLTSEIIVERAKTNNPEAFQRD